MSKGQMRWMMERALATVFAALVAGDGWVGFEVAAWASSALALIDGVLMLLISVGEGPKGPQTLLGYYRRVVPFPAEQAHDLLMVVLLGACGQTALATAWAARGAVVHSAYRRSLRRLEGGGGPR